MRTLRAVGPLLSTIVVLLIGSTAVTGQNANVTTWHQDDPSICTGNCVYRTGTNLNEGVLTTTTVSPTTFGQLCAYAKTSTQSGLDGQVYGQPLVVTNVKWNNQGSPQTVVYVVTQNGSMYAFSGTPPAYNGAPARCNLLKGPVSLLGAGENATYCADIGGNCANMAPVVGIVGTPVIQLTNTNPATGSLFVVVQSEVKSQSGNTFYHRLWAIDVTTLNTISKAQITPTGNSCTADPSFSRRHIQRPGLLLPGDGYAYVAFSMMDGAGFPLPNGMIFAYSTANLGAAPLCLEMSAGGTNTDGAGIWQGGAGAAYGPDSSGKNYIYFNTANGGFDPTATPPLYGDSFIKLYNNPTGGAQGGPALQVTASFTPVDQRQRAGYDDQGNTCPPPNDIDFGSGGVMLIPETDINYPYLAVSGDKEGGIWFMDRTTPGGYNGDGSCSGTGNGGTGDKNVQTFPFNGTGTSDNGPVIHTNPAYWKGGSPVKSYLFIGSQDNGTHQGDAGYLLRYQLCSVGLPIITNSSTNGCTPVGAHAYEGTTPVDFPYGVTPVITASGALAGDAVAWAIWGDGGVIPSTVQFQLCQGCYTYRVSQPGRLYAFDAASATDANMPKLYSSADCIVNGSPIDQLNPAIKFTVPTVANGYVYLGTMGPAQPRDQNFPGDGPASPYNSGSFYIFGPISPSRTCGS